MEWVLGVLALGVLLVALYRYLLRVQGRPAGPPHASRPPAECDRPVRAPETVGDDPFFAEVDRFLRAPARERRSPSTGAIWDGFSDLVTLVGDRAVATRLVAFHGSIDAAIESVVRDRR
jgi:hypothetical protein